MTSMFDIQKDLRAEIWHTVTGSGRTPGDAEWHFDMDIEHHSLIEEHDDHDLNCWVCLGRRTCTDPAQARWKWMGGKG